MKKTQFTKKHIILMVIIGVICFAMGSVGTFAALKLQNTEDTKPITTDIQICSLVYVKTYNADGMIVTMDDSSTFAQLDVFIDKNSLTEHYELGDYLNVYYNGIIKDGSPAEFQKVYKVEEYRMESELD